MPKKKDKSGGGGSNATTPQRKLSDDYSSTPTSPSNHHVKPGDSYELKPRQPDDQSIIVIVQKILQSAFTSHGPSSLDNLPTKNEAARSGARAANFFRFIHKMKPCPKAAKIQMGRVHFGSEGGAPNGNRPDPPPSKPTGQTGSLSTM